MHPIQRHIIKQLTLSESKRYSELCPDDVEGNLFMYHMEQLMKEGLVTRDDKRYILTTEGKKHASIINVDTGVLRPQPKITTTVIVRDNDDRYLLFKWRRQPFIHKVSFIYGKTDFGKSIWDNARRELVIKAGTEAKELDWIGDVYIKVTENNQTFSHMLTHVFQADITSSAVKSTVSTGECLWGRIEDFDKSDLVPGTEEIFELYQNSKRPFLEEITVKS